jgi:hypothetical protein
MNKQEALKIIYEALADFDFGFQPSAKDVQELREKRKAQVDKIKEDLGPEHPLDCEESLQLEACNVLLSTKREWGVWL